MMLTADDYKKALLSVSACNLSGLVHSLSEVLPRIWEEARQCGKGTDFVNGHAIVFLYTSQMAHLSGVGLSDVAEFEKALLFCEKQVAL